MNKYTELNTGLIVAFIIGFVVLLFNWILEPETTVKKTDKDTCMTTCINEKYAKETCVPSDIIKHNCLIRCSKKEGE